MQAFGAHITYLRKGYLIKMDLSAGIKPMKKNLFCWAIYLSKEWRMIY